MCADEGREPEQTGPVWFGSGPYAAPSAASSITAADASASRYVSVPVYRLYARTLRLDRLRAG